MKYELIAIDMDGTLLNERNEVSGKNREVLFKAMSEGIRIVLSTGRILNSALYYSKDIGLEDPIVACNGALISLGSEEDIIYKNPINMDSAKRIIELAEKDKIYYHFYDINTFYAKKADKGFLKDNEHYKDSLKKQQVNCVIFNDFREILNYEKPIIYKIIFIEENIEKLSKFREKLKEIDGINVSSSWHNNIEVMNKGVSKGTGLKYLIEKMNIDKSKVVAIGDNENDIPMFNVAGLAIGMKNGIENIKEHVDVFTTTNVEDGVARAIEKYVLNK